MSIRTKLLAAFGGVLAMLASLSTLGLMKFSAGQDPMFVMVIALGGYVVKGSVERPAHHLVFKVSDGKETMTVVSTGSVPEMFRDGQGVVLEGAVEEDGRFHSDTLLIKHNGEYRPPTGGEKAPNRANLAEGD